MTTQENVKYTTGGDRELIVEHQPAGHYVIKALGAGQPPKITEQAFTSKREALIALDKYNVENARALEKLAFKKARTVKTEE